MSRYGQMPGGMEAINAEEMIAKLNFYLSVLLIVLVIMVVTILRLWLRELPEYLGSWGDWTSSILDTVPASHMWAQIQLAVEEVEQRLEDQAKDQSKQLNEGHMREITELKKLHKSEMQRRGKSSLDVQMQIRQEHLTEYNYLMNKIGKLNSKLRAKWCPECKRQACASCKTLQVQLESLKVQLEVAQAERHPDLEGIRKENEEKWQRLFTDYSTQLKDNNSKYNTKILELNQEINWSNMKYRKLLREYELCNEQQQHAATVWSRALTYHTNPNALASYQAPVTSYNVAVVDNQQVNSNPVREQPQVTYTDVPNVPKEPIFSPAAEFALSKMKGVPPSRVKELTVPQPPGGWLLIAQSAPPAPMGTQANPAPLPIQPTQTVIQAQGNPPQQTMAPTPVSNPVRLRWDNFRKAHTACEEWFDPSGKDKSGNSKSGKDNHLQKVRGWIEANKITSKADYDQILQDCQAVKAFIDSLDGKDKQQKAMLGNTSLFKFAKRTLGTFYAGKATGANGQDPPNQSLVERPHELRQWRSDMAAYARKHQIDDCMDPGSAW